MKPGWRDKSESVKAYLSILREASLQLIKNIHNFETFQPILVYLGLPEGVKYKPKGSHS